MQPMGVQVLQIRVDQAVEPRIPKNREESSSWGFKRFLMRVQHTHSHTRAQKGTFSLCLISDMSSVHSPYTQGKLSQQRRWKEERRGGGGPLVWETTKVVGSRANEWLAAAVPNKFSQSVHAATTRAHVLPKYDTRHTYMRNLISCILEAAVPAHDRFCSTRIAAKLQTSAVLSFSFHKDHSTAYIDL